MPPKKSTGPPPQSDESDSDFEEEPARKPQKKPSKPSKPSKSSKQEKEKELDPEEALKRAADTIFDGSEGEDDDSDLFALEIPPRPDFLVRPNKKDRLMILNVEVNNFKSYYGKASIGPFHKSFTSIIGPNGSGKSNLIDSLLFVFGFRASKIRSTKVCNLIHKSAGREPDSCTVTIHFQRIVDVPGHYEVVKDSLFDISRTAYRNNSSSYAINGRPASKNEVEARLRLVDIDIEHNRFLILQGEVEQIAMMKPVKTTKSETGMVEYLEDIIGSNRLERFVKKFQRRVNRLNCDLSQQRIARDHARNSKIAMEGPVRTAIEFLNKENEAKTIEMKLNLRRKKKYKDRAAPKQAELDKQKEEMKEIAVKLDENKSESKRAEDEERKLSKDRSKIEKEIDQLTKEIDDLSAEETRRNETIKRYETDITKTEAEKDKEQKKRATFVSAPEKAEKKLAKWKEEVEQLIETESTANAAADKNLEEFEKRAEKLKEEQKKAQETWSKSNTAFISARSEATVARNEYEDMNKMANSGSKKLDQLKEHLKTAEEKFNKEKEEIEKLRPEVDSWNEKLRNLKTSLPTVREEVKTTNLALNQCQDRLDVLRQQNASGSGGNHLVKMLMKEKQEGRIPSFIGRLGDLGVIDKKYAGAICTNYGAILNNLITGTSDDSKKIMNFLYKNKLPRTTIQSLDRVPHVRAEDMAPIPKDRYPGPRLFDLIECEPEVRHIYYRAVRNSVVAESTAEALKMNKMSSCKNVNIVTLQGAMVNSSGSITGGGQTLTTLILTDKNKKPKEVTAEDRRAEKELTVEVAQLKTKSDELREQEHRLDAQLIEARRKVHELEQRLSIVTATVDSEAENIKSLRKAVENQEKEASKVKVDAKELEAKKKLAEELEIRQDELSEEAEITRKRQAEVQSKLDGIFKELVQCHRDEAKEASNKRSKLEKDMAKETANVANSGRNIAKCDENIARMEKEIEKKKQMCTDLQERATDGEALEGKKSALVEVEKKKTDMETQYKDIMKKQSELSDAETKLEEELRKCNEVIMELKEKMNADTMKVKEIQKKLDGLQVNRIPRFQFLTQSSRPEDLAMQFDDELPVDENQSPEENEKQKKHMACVLSDRAYAMEFELRQKVLKNTESYEDVEGDKMVQIQYLTDAEVDEISDRDAEELQFKLKTCEQQLETMKSKVDLSCIDAYVVKVNQFNEQVIKFAMVHEDHRKHNERLQAIKKDRLEEFHSAFEFIGKHLVAVYKMLTDGGDAKLEYIDKDDPFKEGISFMVRPAKKAWKQIQFLSGGEKTLSSLALIFALHMFRPTPFYVMDEIDAALDYRNVSIIAQYVRQKTENAQFIIISLRNNMFELANRLVGIYKVDGCTQNVAIDPQKVCEMAKGISDSLGQITCTLPEEITQQYSESMSRQSKEITAQEKQYPNFPSSSEISKAEKIVSVEGRVRKQLNHTTSDTTSGSRPQSKAATQANATERQTFNRPESRVNQIKIPTPRLVERAASQSSRTPRKERNTEADETTPPAKRTNSTTSKSPAKPVAGRSTKKKKSMSDDDEDSE